VSIACLSMPVMTRELRQISFGGLLQLSVEVVGVDVLLIFGVLVVLQVEQVRCWLGCRWPFRRCMGLHLHPDPPLLLLSARLGSGRESSGGGAEAA